MKLLLALICCFGVGFSHAASVTDATIQIVATQDDGSANGWFWIRVNTSFTALPACHTAPTDRVAWDLSIPVSKYSYGIAMSAHVSGKRVNVDTHDTCFNGYAKVRNIYFSP
ncbi:MAG TPA: hypothetical protein VM532_09890 [Burkholderiales bacterium]|jgi:hypothetical protein|nr:hypothetical protein [Burkholderiales bacterium]